MFSKHFWKDNKKSSSYLQTLTSKYFKWILNWIFLFPWPSHSESTQSKYWFEDSWAPAEEREGLQTLSPHNFDPKITRGLLKISSFTSFLNTLWIYYEKIDFNVKIGKYSSIFVFCFLKNWIKNMFCEQKMCFL